MLSELVTSHKRSAKFECQQVHVHHPVLETSRDGRRGDDTRPNQESAEVLHCFSPGPLVILTTTTTGRVILPGTAHPPEEVDTIDISFAEILLTFDIVQTCVARVRAPVALYRALPAGFLLSLVSSFT